MKKIFISFCSFVILSQLVAAQKSDLIINKSGKDFYLEHSVGTKESLYSLGRLYNVHPKFIASYNKLDFSKGLSIDQKIRIPLTDTNFTQKGNTGTPVYYNTDPGEGLMKISKANNDVTLASLRYWNSLSEDNTGNNKKLIVGFLLSKEMPSITIVNKPVDKIEEIAVDEVKKDEVAKPVEPITTVKTEQIITKPQENNLQSGNSFFKSHFEKQIKSSPVTKSETVTSGIFKTASGWQDAKYYLLIDKVEPGTIIKVVNPDNNKVVFAKVLGEMSGIRQNEGIDIRLSNAAATALGIAEQDKYIVKINY